MPLPIGLREPKPGECELRAGRLTIRIEHQDDGVWEVLLVGLDLRPGSFAQVLLAFSTDRQQALQDAQALCQAADTVLQWHHRTGEIVT